MSFKSMRVKEMEQSTFDEIVKKCNLPNSVEMLIDSYATVYAIGDGFERFDINRPTENMYSSIIQPLNCEKLSYYKDSRNFEASLYCNQEKNILLECSNRDEATLWLCADKEQFKEAVQDIMECWDKSFETNNIEKYDLLDEVLDNDEPNVEDDLEDIGI